MSLFRKFFSTVQGSVKGLLNPEELFRSILTALGSGSILGLLTAVLSSVVAHASTIFPSPSTSSLATMLLTLVLDLLRRQNQGVTPAKAQDPAGVHA